MECPKCGVPQDDGRDECASCGVVFAKWRPSQRRTAEQPALVYTIPERRTSGWLVAAAVLIVFILGMTWTAKRKAERAKRDPVAELHAEMDRINAKGVAVRQRLAKQAEEEQRRRYAAEQAAAPPPKMWWPDGLTEAFARETIPRCTGFKAFPVRLPRSYREGSFAMESDYPRLLTAIRNGLVTVEMEGREHDGRLVTVKPGLIAWIGFTMTDSEYIIDQYSRELREITSTAYGGEFRASVDFTWAYQPPAAARLFDDADRAAKGWVTFEKRGSAWVIVEGRLDGPGGDSPLYR